MKSYRTLRYKPAQKEIIESPYKYLYGTVEHASNDIVWACNEIYKRCKKYNNIIFLGNSVILFCQYMKLKYPDLKIFCVPVSNINSLFRISDEEARNKLIEEYGEKVIRKMMGMTTLKDVVFIDMTVSGNSIVNTARLFQLVLREDQPVDFVNIVRPEDLNPDTSGAYSIYRNVNEILQLGVQFVRWTQYDVWENFEGSKGFDYFPDVEIHRSIQKFSPQDWVSIKETTLEDFEQTDHLSTQILQMSLFEK